MVKPALVDLDNESQRALVNALPIPVLIARTDGVVSFLNDCWHEYTGQTRDPNAGVSWPDCVHPEDRDRVAHEWQAAIVAGLDEVEMEYRLRQSASGSYRWFHMRTTALRDARGDVVQWIAAAMDIQEERQQQLAITRLYENSLAVAQTLQSAMLPPALPHVDGLRFEAFYLPSERSLSVAGDWFDAFTLPDGSVAVAIGDVTGHGIEAAVLMAKARYSMRAIMRRSATLRTGNVASVLRSVEDSLASEHPEARATAFLGIISPDRTRLRYANAGHPPPLTLDASGRCTWVEGHDLPLGWRFVLERHDRFLDLSGVSRVLLYTDGLIEAGRDIIAGMKRLVRVSQTHSRNDGSFLDSVVKETLVDAPHDDVAALSVRFG